ncbi:MAG: signal peptidase I [Candidatus Pacebacteria bacterium]|nr:signal peptidase I [Candidatus Paceibacterota bacterium]
MRQFLAFAGEILKIVLLALIIVLPIRYFIFQPFIVKGASMEPNFHNGDYLIVDELTYRLKEPQRGEVIVFRYPLDPSERFIKRIIGLPTETVEIKDGQIFVTDKFGTAKTLEEKYLEGVVLLGSVKQTLADNQYFVLGDNRLNSSDSRKWGAVSRDEIIGRVLIRAWPPTKLDYFTAPSYQF